MKRDSLNTVDFLKKFKHFDPSVVSVTGYPANYCRHVLTHLDYYAAIYNQIIELAVRATKKAVTELTVLDYGTGNGFLSIFAKHIGFKKVWASDLSSTFLDAAQRTSVWAGIDVDDFIMGDVDKVRLYFQKLQCRPDILLATDVIEHIYDIDGFFAELKRLNSNLVSVFTTASNPYNYKKVRQLHKMQHQDEWIGYKSSLVNSEENGFSELSFYEQRSEIIKKEFERLDNLLVSKLAIATRGKKREDILKEVNNYLSNGIFPSPPEDPFWVCDPYTGSWTERILTLKEFEKVYQKNNFLVSVYNGFYNCFSKRGITRQIVKGVNGFVSKNQRFGKYFAPYIVLFGEPKNSFSSKTETEG